MNPARVAAAVAVSAAVLMTLGTVLWGILLPALFSEHAEGEGEPPRPPRLGFILVAQIWFAIFLVLLVGVWTSASGFWSAFLIGGVAGSLVNASTTFAMYAQFHSHNLSKVALEPLLALPVFGTASGVITLIL